MRQFPGEGPLHSISMNFFSPLTKAITGNQHVLVSTDRYSNLTLALPVRYTTEVHATQAVIDFWVVMKGSPESIISDNGPHLLFKLFATGRRLSGAKELSTTDYQPHTNGQSE